MKHQAQARDEYEAALPRRTGHMTDEGAASTGVAALDAVLRQFSAAQLDEFGRRDAVAGQVAVQRSRAAIPWFAEIAHQQLVGISSFHAPAGEAF